MKFFCALLCLLFCCISTFAMSVGVSPNALSFKNSSEYIYLSNPTEKILPYTIKGCNLPSLQFHTKGILQPQSMVKKEIRYNPALRTNHSCTLHILFSHPQMEIGFSLPLTFDTSVRVQPDETLLQGFFALDDTSKKEGVSLKVLIIAGVFLLSVFIILRYF